MSHVPLVVYSHADSFGFDISISGGKKKKLSRWKLFLFEHLQVSITPSEIMQKISTWLHISKGSWENMIFFALWVKLPFKFTCSISVWGFVSKCIKFSSDISLLCGHRDRRMPRSSQQKGWRFGMPTGPGTSWTTLGSQIERRATWDLCTVSSGGTLVPSTQTCTQVQSVTATQFTVQWQRCFLAATQKVFI